jgi:hypothetical protein|tara:strand:- start:16 stop:195 length:180 start_codon:yes stop_codon:yes gene_type:complete
MIITLIKNTTLESGKKLVKGTNLGVVNEYGQKLIKAGKAVEFGAEAPVEIEDKQINNLD